MSERHRYFYFIPLIGMFAHWYRMYKDGWTPAMYPLELLLLNLWHCFQVYQIIGLFLPGPGPIPTFYLFK